MARMSLQLDRRFYKQAKGVYEKYNFDVGVIEDGPHYKPLTAQQARKRGWKKDNTLKVSQAKAKGMLKTYAGGPARAVGRKSTQTLSEVSESLRQNTGINFYTKPFKSKKNRDITRFVKHFFELCAGKQEKKRLENTLQAIVRNPILRGDYGRNAPATVKTKGFNRFMIDTAQLFKGIRAKVRLKNVSR